MGSAAYAALETVVVELTVIEYVAVTSIVTFEEPSGAITIVGETVTFAGATPDEDVIAEVAAAATCACIAEITFGSLLLPGGRENVSDSVTGADTTSENVIVAPTSLGVTDAAATYPDDVAIIEGLVGAGADETVEASG